MHETLYVADSMCRTYMQTGTAVTYAVLLLFRLGPVAQIDFTCEITRPYIRRSLQPASGLAWKRFQAVTNRKTVRGLKNGCSTMTVAS
jgi:hypothetical protein